MYKKYRISYYDYEDEQHYFINTVALSEIEAKDNFYKEYNCDVDITTIEEIS